MTTIEINLVKAYYNQGFFNIRVRYNHLIAENDEEISVQLENKIFITAKVNRTANRNGTPRIMCGGNLHKLDSKNFRQEFKTIVSWTEDGYINLSSNY